MQPSGRTLVITQSLSCEPGCQKPGPDAAYGNPCLCRYRISEAYLKGILGCVIGRSIQCDERVFRQILLDVLTLSEFLFCVI